MIVGKTLSVEVDLLTSFRASFRGEHVALKRRARISDQTQLFTGYSFNDSMEFDLIITFQKFCKEALLWQMSVTQHILPFYGIDLGTSRPRFCMVPLDAQGIFETHRHVGGPKTSSIRRYVWSLSRIFLLRLKASLAV